MPCRHGARAESPEVQQSQSHAAVEPCAVTWYHARGRARAGKVQHLCVRATHTVNARSTVLMIVQHHLLCCVVNTCNVGQPRQRLRSDVVPASTNLLKAASKKETVAQTGTMLAVSRCLATHSCTTRLGRPFLLTRQSLRPILRL